MGGVYRTTGDAKRAIIERLLDCNGLNYPHIVVALVGILKGGACRYEDFVRVHSWFVVFAFGAS